MTPNAVPNYGVVSQLRISISNAIIIPKKSIFYSVINREYDPKSTIEDSEPFQKRARARRLKNQRRDYVVVDDINIEFVTAPDPK